MSNALKLHIFHVEPFNCHLPEQPLCRPQAGHEGGQDQVEREHKRLRQRKCRTYSGIKRCGQISQIEILNPRTYKDTTA